MLTRLRNHISYANVVATLALFLALSGGAAYAAKHYLITSPKQIKPSVLASLKGKAGKAGPQGAAGPAGAVGPQGPAGNPGANGTNGTDGINGTAGESVKSKSLSPGNKECPDGGSEFEVGSAKATFACNGQTGFTETLPEGKTETGTFSWHLEGGAKETFTEVPLSFSIPLPERLIGSRTVAWNYVTIEEQENHEPQMGCEGTVEDPTAKPGYLCLYQGVTLVEETGEVLVEEVKPPGAFEGEEGAGTMGALIDLKYNGPEGRVLYAGSWAVTAS